jgi:hypothetical protein
MGHTRDASMLEGEVEVLQIDALPPDRRDRRPRGGPAQQMETR